MKDVMKKALSFLTILVLVLALVPAMSMSVKADGTNPTTGNIIIENVTEGDSLTGYKVIKIDYNDDGTVSYAWINDAISEAVANAVNKDSVSVEEFYDELSADERTAAETAIVQTVYTAAASYNTIGPSIATKNSDTNEILTTFNGVEKGGYLIVPTATTDVYQIMIAVVQPEAENGAYVIKDVKIKAKKNEISVTKDVLYDDTYTTGIGKKVTYEVIVDVPTYDTSATDTTYIVSDTLSSGLTLDAGSIVVTGYTATREAIASATGIELALDKYPEIYTLTTGAGSNDDPTFTLTFSYRDSSDDTSSLEENSIKTIKITYTATINNNAIVGGVGNNNTVKLTYANYPFTEANMHTTKDDSATVYTYDLTIIKVDDDETTETKLSGAEFDVYMVVDSGSNEALNGEKTDVGDVTALPSGKDYKLVAESIKTGDEGTVTLSNLDAGTYYLVETVAPAGYTLLNTAVEVEISAAADTDNDYKIEKEIENSEGFTLPQTGGTGTLIFTVVGISLMLVAVVAFFVLRKREVNKN